MILNRRGLFSILSLLYSLRNQLQVKGSLKSDVNPKKKKRTRRIVRWTLPPSHKRKYTERRAPQLRKLFKSGTVGRGERFVLGKGSVACGRSNPPREKVEKRETPFLPSFTTLSGKNPYPPFMLGSKLGDRGDDDSDRFRRRWLRVVSVVSTSRTFSFPL